MRHAAPRAGLEVIDVSHPEFLQQPHVAESDAAAWTHHRPVPRAIPLPNTIGMSSLKDGIPRTVATSTRERGVAILSGHGYSSTETDTLIQAGVLVTG